MKTPRFVITAVAFFFVTVAFAQRVNRGDICQNIPNLTDELKSVIEKLSSQHQKTMDALRVQFRSEADPVNAREIKKKMFLERNEHYQAIFELLTAEQKLWFQQNCLRYTIQGYGQDRGYGRGYSQGQGQGYGRGRGYGRGYNQGQGQGYGGGRGYGRGYSKGSTYGKGRRCPYRW